VPKRSVKIRKCCYSEEPEELTTIASSSPRSEAEGECTGCSGDPERKDRDRPYCRAKRWNKPPKTNPLN
jgi:hypothetical protein